MIRTLLMLAVVGLSFTSCKKDYTCKCVQTYVTTAYTQYGIYHPQSTTASTYSNTFRGKEDDAESWCRNSESYSVNTYGSGEAQRTATTVVDCELY